MKRNNVAVMAAIIFIAFMVGDAFGHVGEPVICKPAEVFEWWFPIAILGITGVPFMLGYLGGKDS